MSLSADDQRFLDLAIAEARVGLAEGGIPIGAALVADGEVLGLGHNRRIQSGSAILHGETDAVERAGRQPASVYRRATMYTTLAPCAMCSGTIVMYGIGRVVIGERTTFAGETQWLESRGVEVVHADSEECRALLAGFIDAHPEVWNEDIGEEDA